MGALLQLVVMVAASASVGYFQVITENDLFGNGDDRHYTNGISLGWASEACQLHWVDRVTRLIRLSEPRGDDCGRSRAGLTVGHAMFTPDNIWNKEPDLHDRPYAGWLWVTGSLYGETIRDPVHDRGWSRLELSLGVVGPASGAGPMQRAVHALIQAPPPNGWGWQLKNEPAAMLSYDYRRRFGWRPARHLELDLTPAVAASLGNVFTRASIAFTVRMGDRMLADWGPDQPTFEAPGRGFGWYIFATGELRAVAWDIFLDGNTAGGGPRVEKLPLVVDGRFGVAFSFWRLRFSYTNTVRSDEFQGQKGPDNFGSLSLAAAW